MYETWLRAFHLVATTGGFTAAARALNIGQPTVSTHIKSLEDRFGVELFYRRGRRVELSPMGDRLLTVTRGLYGHHGEAIRLLQHARLLETGRIDLAAVGPFDVIELLEAFREKFPGIEATVSVTGIGDVLEAVRNFKADVAIVGEEIRDPAFHCHFYNRHRVLVIVNAEHRLARRKTIGLEKLHGEDMVLPPRSSTTRKAFDAAIHAAGVEIRPVMEINSREAVREAVYRGFGFGVVSETEFMPHPRLRALDISDANVFTRAYLLCLKERRDRPIIKAFLDTTESAIKSHKT